MKEELIEKYHEYVENCKRMNDSKVAKIKIKTLKEYYPNIEL